MHSSPLGKHLNLSLWRGLEQPGFMVVIVVKDAGSRMMLASPRQQRESTGRGSSRCVTLT